jgi:hypothetical protein
MRKALIKLLERLTQTKTFDSVLEDFVENINFDDFKTNEQCACIFCGKPFTSFKERASHIIERDCVVDFQVLPKRKVEIFLNDEYNPN